MAPKQRTKGQKEIYAGNKEALKFYTALTVAPNFGWLLSAGSAAAGLATMYSGSIAKFSPTGQLLDAGVDLSMTEGMIEYMKDAIIFSAIVVLLNVFSGFFLLLWFVIPTYVFYQLWINFLWPWIRGSDDDGQDMADGQGKKRSRVTKVIRR